MKRFGWVLLSVVCLLTMPCRALMNSDLPRDEEGDWVFDAQARVRVISRDNPDFNSGTDDGRIGVQTQAQLGGTFPAGKGWLFRWLLQESEVWDHVTATKDNDAKLEVQELYADYDHEELTVSLGRIPLSLGDERLVGVDEWSNVGRRFDGIKVGWDFGEVQLLGWWASLGGSPLTYANDGEFWGLQSTWPRSGDGQTEAYLFWNHDPSPAPAPTNFITLGGRHFATHGPWNYDVEAAGQFGNVTAYALALEGGYTAGPVKISAGFDSASGDSSPGVGQSTTFQNLFPSNHDRYGIMDYQSWRNMHHLWGGLSWQIEPWLQFQTGGHAFWLANSRDFWYGASGRPNRTTNGLPFIDPTGSSGTEIGQELDFVLTATPHPQCTIEAGYAHFFGGPYINGVNSLYKFISKDSDFWYVQTTGRY